MSTLNRSRLFLLNNLSLLYSLRDAIFLIYLIYLSIAIVKALINNIYNLFTYD